MIPIDTFAAAEFLVRHMYRPTDLGSGESFFAIAETALPIEGDSWFWTDDNAKVLEFLCGRSCGTGSRVKLLRFSDSSGRCAADR